MKTINIDNFISNDSNALSVITDFKSNKLIIKGNTGIGGTSAILSITDQTVIIISPYLGMIQDKEHQNNNEHNLFIYQDSKDDWNDVKDRLADNNHFILNTTPDQILKIKKINPILFEKIKKIALFIDESHIAAEADYRESLSLFNHLVFNEWQNYFTLSTATPVFNNIDIPAHIRETLEIVKIQRRNEIPKDVTIFNYRFYQEWVLKELSQGHKVVLFSNDENVYKNFLQFYKIKIQVLVGKHLEKKIVTYREADELNLTNKVDTQKDLFILSTKYITGFDIPFDASVAIISNEKSYTDVRYINDITQAYGRIRKTVINAAIFYNRNTVIESVSDTLFIKNFNKGLLNPTPEQCTGGIVNHTLVLNSHLPIKLRQQTYNSIEEFSENLKSYGFNPTIEYVEDCVVIPSGITVSDRVQNLRTTDIEELKKFTDYVFNNIKGDNEDYNGFGEHLLIVYCASYIAAICENEWLDNKLKNIKRYPDLVKILKTFIDVNILYTNHKGNDFLAAVPSYWNKNELDELIKFKVSDRLLSTATNDGAISNSFKYVNHASETFRNCIFLINTFYVINLVEKGNIDDETKRSIEINHIISEKLKEDYIAAISSITDLPKKVVTDKIEAGDKSLNDKMYNRSIKTFFKHTSEKVIRNLSFQPTADEIVKINIKLDKYINMLNKVKDGVDAENLKSKLNHIDYNYDRQQNSHRLYLLGMASLHIANHMAGFKCSKKYNREYNIVTKVPKALRYRYTPYHIIEVDIRNANAQIVDKLFNTNIGMNVYENLQIKYNITRDEAKVLYNSTLNNYRLPKAKAVRIYMDAGYPYAIASTIAERTTSSKIYNDMCTVEESIILKYKAASKIQNAIRCHDALVMLATSHNVKNLPTNLDGVEFKITQY